MLGNGGSPGQSTTGLASLWRGANWAPVALWVATVAFLPLLAFNPGPAAAIGALALHVIAANWLLIARWPHGLGGWRLAGVQLAIGAPSAIFTAVMIVLIAREGDIAWEALPFVIVPALLVWPVVIVSLARGPAQT